MNLKSLHEYLLKQTTCLRNADDSYYINLMLKIETRNFFKTDAKGMLHLCKWWWKLVFKNLSHVLFLIVLFVVKNV